MSSLRLTCRCCVAIVVAITGFTSGVWGADEYVAPPQVERDAVAALRAKGAILQVDAGYRVSSVVMTANCTNDDLKLLAGLERLTSVQITSTRITDDGIEHLKGLNRLTSVIVSTGITEKGISALKAAAPNLRVTSLARPGGTAGTPAPVAKAPPPATRGQAADEVGVKFMASGLTAKMGGYQPLRAEMNESADSVKKAPEGIAAAKYGALKLGTKSWRFILDEPEGQAAKLYVDTNGDGDLTNDPATTWASRKVGSFTQYSGSARVELGEGNIGTVNMYRFDPNDAQRATLKNVMMFYPDYGYELTLKLDGKDFTTSAPGAQGTMSLWIDRDGNGERSNRRETVSLGRPFNFTGTTYVLNRDGDAFKLEKPTAVLPVTPLPPNLAVGQKAIPFVMATLDGDKVDFPKAYAGKLVMLDFWATWCGPCIAELPNVKKAYADWHDKGFEILGISFDNANMDEKVKSFLKDQDLPWTQIYEGKGWNTSLGEQYEVSSIPFVLLVDGDSGEIVATVRSLRGPGLSNFIGEQLAKKNGSASGSASRPLP